MLANLPRQASSLAVQANACYIMMVKMARLLPVFWIALLVRSSSVAQEAHDHGPPEKLGTVSFPISCRPVVQAEFNRGIALLHSFAYSAAESSLRRVTRDDPNCAIAHWGI